MRARTEVFIEVFIEIAFARPFKHKARHHSCIVGVEGAMNIRLLGAALPPTRGCRAWGPALATVCLAVTPGTAWAQHGGHGHAHAAPPARITSSYDSGARAHFHAPPYYLFPRERLG